MALTIAEIMDDLSLESQGDFNFSTGTGDELALMVSWLNHVQKDLLHTGVYKHLLRTSTTVATGAGINAYALSPTDIRRIDAVYDTANSTFLAPAETIFPPAGVADPEDKPKSPKPPVDASHFRVSGEVPQFYRLQTVVTANVNAHTLVVWPAPLRAEHASVLNIYYTKHAPTIALPTDNTNLIIDEDGRDALFAGLAWRMWSYYDNEAKAAMWRNIYESSKFAEQVQ